jgi:hypothetical protein
MAESDAQSFGHEHVLTWFPGLVSFYCGIIVSRQHDSRSESVIPFWTELLEVIANGLRQITVQQGIQQKP